jgi:predicted nucleic acid-binding protein
MAGKFTVYLETTIPSYLTGRPSNDLIMAGKQANTRKWWEERRPHYDLFISAAVLDEAGRGDPSAAARRLACLENLPILQADEDVFKMIDAILQTSLIPEKAATDAAHIAIAVRHGIDFLMTWNCTHIANAEIQFRIGDIVTKCGYNLPRMCTPDELFGFPQP